MAALAEAFQLPGLHFAWNYHQTLPDVASWHPHRPQLQRIIPMGLVSGGMPSATVRVWDISMARSALSRKLAPPPAPLKQSGITCSTSPRAITKPLPMLPRGIPPDPNPIRINHFIHRIPGICLFYGISGGISAPRHQTMGLAATHRMC